MSSQIYGKFYQIITINLNQLQTGFYQNNNKFKSRRRLRHLHLVG
nr:MAG TPA: hypothetical protein [Caudoviricetes sp.]